jgi:uncharacterized membrane protein
LSYLTFKSIHIFGIILFMGNIIITGYWKALADRTGNPRIIAFAQRLVTQTDWIFTAGGVTLIMVGAYGMAYAGGLDLRGENWLLWGQGLFVLSGIIWATILIPVQIKQAGLARGFEDGSPVPEDYWRFNRRWYVWGILATVIPLANLYWMVFKP